MKQKVLRSVSINLTLASSCLTCVDLRLKVKGNLGSYTWLVESSF